MQIVIKISDSLYSKLIDMNSESDTCSFNESALVESIQNGKPLPKGHEDLIDRGEVIKSLFDYHNGEKTIGQCIDDVPAIIEEDK